MKRYYSTALMLALSAFVASAKVVKTFEIDSMDKYKTLSELIPESEKYSVDSICVSGYFEKSNFQYLRDLTINGSLTGIDLSGTEILEIPDLTFGNMNANASDGSGLSKLQYIRLPYTLQIIGYRAFSQSDLRCIAIPKVYEIKEEAFAYCSELRDVTISSFVPPRTDKGSAFHQISPDAVLNVPSDSKAKYSSLAAYSKFKAINEQEGLYNIRGYYLDGTPLNDLLGEDAMKVDSIVVGGRLTEDDVQTLCNNICYGRLSGMDLSNCIFPDNEIPEDAFNDFVNSKTQTHLNNISLPYGVERIGLGAFSNAFLYSLSIPSSVKSLGRSCFENATLKGDLVIPEGVEEIGKYALDGMTVTGDVYLPSTLNKVDTHCFTIVLTSEDLDKAKNFYCNRMTPPNYASDTNVSYGKLFPLKLPIAKKWTLYVPKGAKEAFMSNKAWGAFPNIIETPELDGGTSGISSAVAAEGQTAEKRIYTLDGRYVGTDMGRLGSGVYLVGGKKVIK